MFTQQYIYCDQSRAGSVLSEIANLGLGVEILFEDTSDLWPHVKWENLLDLVDAIGDMGISAAVHGPFHGLNLGTRDTNIRRYSCDALCAGLEVARAVRSPHMVFHTGYLPQYPPKSRAKWLDEFSRQLDRLLAKATDLEVRLAMENTYETDTSLFEEIFNRFPTPALGMCLDTGHANCFGKVEPAQWVRRFADRIVHVHCSDNDGRDDLHLGLGQGIVDFRSLLEPLAGSESEITVTLEVGAEDAVSSRDYLNQLFISPLREETL